MPRAFLITRRRYGEFEETAREFSPERGVRLAEYGGGQQPTSDGASECGSESSNECPEELYNLTKLAEVSLAAAAGTLVHPATLCSRPPHHEAEKTRYFFEQIESERENLIELKSRRVTDDVTLEGARLPAGINYNTEFEPETIAVSDTTITTPLTPVSGKHSPTDLQNQNDRIDHQEGSEDHECPDCGKKYSTSSNLARHRQTHRSLGDKKARRCPHCDKVYVSIPAFSMHVRTHNQGCKCHYCGKCFSRPWLLQGHIRTHTGEKPFKCTICNKAFADKSNLRAHIQTHSNTKPHVCNRCGKAFALKSYLYKHEESSCMRAHQQQRTTEKREVSTSPTSTNSTRSSTSSNASPQPTASPTSVIVPPRNYQNRDSIKEHQPIPNSAFSAIIRHTRTTPEIVEQDSVTKRPKCSPDIEVNQNKDLLSRMVIRTSVISPNPKHVARYNEKKMMQQQQIQSQNKQSLHPFNFNDPTRISAFSRPQSMTLNLAIA